MNIRYPFDDGLFICAALKVGPSQAEKGCKDGLMPPQCLKAVKVMAG
jgi:hypothetical protein